MFIVGLGAFFFGLLLGWICYRTLRLKAGASVLAEIAAIIGVLGGAALNRKRPPKRKVLGLSVPGIRPDLEQLARQIGEAASQFGRLAGEVHAAREQAAKIGKALS